MSIQKNKPKKVFSTSKEKALKFSLDKNLISITKTINSVSKLVSTATQPTSNNNNNSNNKTTTTTKLSNKSTEQENNQTKSLPATDTDNSQLISKQTTNTNKKSNKKEETLKEIKKYYLLNTNLNQIDNSIRITKSNEFIKYLAKEFLDKCKLILDEKQFKDLIMKLVNVDYNKFDDKIYFDDVIDNLYRIVNKYNELKLNFCAFLTCQNSNNYDLFMESLQYEKTNEFLQMLEMFITNKCTMKRLLQSIISSCSSNLPITNDNNVLKKCQDYQQQIIINEIKTKVRSATKNNPFINYELDYLFDQQAVNARPQYEKISLINNTNQISSENANETEIKQNIQNNNNSDFYYEYIDLTKDSSINNNGTKKCACECHQIQTHQTDSNDTLLQTIFNHCILCSLKLIKGRLCIKCEGKKAIPLNYKLTNNSNNAFKT